MKIDVGIRVKKVTSVVRGDNIIVFKGKSNDIPVLPAAFPDMRTIICADLPVLGNGNQSGAQAFVDEYPVAQPQSRIERGGVFQSGPNCRSAHRTTASMPSMGRDG